MAPILASTCPHLQPILLLPILSCLPYADLLACEKPIGGDTHTCGGGLGAENGISPYASATKHAKLLEYKFQQIGLLEFKRLSAHVSSNQKFSGGEEERL